MSEPLDDLIQRTLDGQASPPERTRLEAQLAADPAARGRYDELSRVFQALGAVRVEAAPTGMRDDVLRAIRGAAPARAQVAARAGRPTFSWLRIALPAAAGAIAALVLIANWQGLSWPPGDDRVSGTMSGDRSPGALRLGSGPGAVLVRWSPSESGFQLQIQTGDAPVRIVLEPLTAGVRLGLAPHAALTDSPRTEATLPANTLVIAEGTAPETRATIRVSVTLPDGQLATGEVRLQGLRPTR